MHYQGNGKDKEELTNLLFLGSSLESEGRVCVMTESSPPFSFAIRSTILHSVIPAWQLSPFGHSSLVPPGHQVSKLQLRTATAQDVPCLR